MKKNKLIILLLLFIWIILSSCTNSIASNNEKNTLNDNNSNMENIQTKWLENWDIVAVMKTDFWTMKIKLFTTLVPKTTLNFIGLSKKWYYNNLIFHRTIKDFMIQWGDPEWTWMWWTSIYWEKFDDEFDPNLKNIKYSISMANSWKNTNWSQFFINQVNNSHLDNKHSVFWQVVDWTWVVDKIAKTQTWANDKPKKDIKIISVEIKKYNNWKLENYDFNIDVELKKIEEQEKQELEAKKDKKVEKWDIVAVDYTLTDEKWTKIDSSLDRWEPIEFEVWTWTVIKWFEDWVIWMKIWEKKVLNLTSKEAYWEIDPTKKQVINKSDLKQFIEAWVKLEKWSKLPTQYWELPIIETNTDTITVDLNHPLAWKTLIFDIEIKDIK